MSRLLARIMLALLMLPCAGLIYFVVAVILYEGTRVRDDNVDQAASSKYCLRLCM